MKTALVILNWNGEKWLEQFLPNVISHRSGCTIYVIDNASTDNSVAYLKTHFPEVKIIINKENKGYAGGYNLGLKSINADIYGLINSDLALSPDWLEPIQNLFESRPDIAVIQPKILDYNQPEKFEFAGAGGGLIDNLGYPYCKGRVFESIEYDHGQYDSEYPIFWASGCGFFIRSQDFWAMQGFDESFFAHQEEIDLCWRLMNNGRLVYYCGKSKVYHVGGGTLNSQSPFKTYLNFRNNLALLFKNLSLSQLLWKLPFRLALDGVAALYLAKKNGFGHLVSVIKAHFSFYAMIPQLWRKRGKTTKHFYQTKYLIFKHFLGSKE